MKLILGKGIENILLPIQCLEINACSTTAKCNTILMKYKLEDFCIWKHHSFFASLYPKCSDVLLLNPCILNSTCSKILNLTEKSHRLILKLPFIYKPWGYWILIHSNVFVWTVKQFFILTAFSWEKSVFFHDSTPLFQPQKGEGQGNRGSMCWVSISLHFRLLLYWFFPLAHGNCTLFKSYNTSWKNFNFHSTFCLLL